MSNKIWNNRQNKDKYKELIPLFKIIRSQMIKNIQNNWKN